MNTDIVGWITFDNHTLPVYNSVEEPLFRAIDISSIINYSQGNTSKMLEMCEDDEKLLLPMVVAGQRRKISFTTESGLYNILAQSRVPLARKWRRIIFDELIRMRKDKGRNVIEQFDEWNHKLDDIYFDEETGILMQSVTIAGGDVEQIPVN